MNNELAYFLGLWIAEGSFEEKIGRITITCGDRAVGGFLESGAVLGLAFKARAGRDDQWCINSYELMEMMRFLKMPLVKAPKKWMPEWVWAGQREWACHFLSGMFDGDGYICTTRNKAGYTTASEHLARDVQLLLTNFGIISRLTSVESGPTERVKVSSLQYRVEIIGKNVSLLKQVLQPRIERKAAALDRIPDDLFSRRDGVPVLPLLQGVKSAMPTRVKLPVLDPAIGIARRAGSSTTYETLRRILLECDKARASIAYQKLSKVVSDHYFWDTVTSVEKGESETFDFTIPDTHSFWSNGFISHNTPKSYNFLYELWAMGGKPEATTWQSWQFPTITSPFIPEAEIEAARSDMDEKSFKQEFEACHLPDTKIQLWGGKSKAIREIQPGDLVTHITETGNRTPVEVERIGVTGVKTIMDVMLETGEIISASAHHKFKIHEANDTSYKAAA